MREYKISKRYARSIFSIAEEQKNIETILKDFNHVKTVVNNSKELSNLIASPIIKPDKKCKIISEIFKENISELTLNFLLLLTNKHRINLIIFITEHFESLINEINNRVKVLITTAVEIDSTIKSTLTDRIKEMTKKTILPSYYVDEQLKAGIKIQIEDWVYDGTLQNKIEDLYKRLAFG